MRGIFEMATGTGKTYAALGCLQRLMKKEKRLVTVIACPYNHLITQWIKDIEEFGISCKYIVADSSNPRWKDELADSLLQLRSGIQDKLVVLTTHATFSTVDFIKIIRIANENLFLIVDEVHGIGAPKRREGLIEDYKFRLGLSATPKRWFDAEGTKTIFDYFGDTVFEFPLKKAINTVNPSTGETYLTPYEYKPFFVELTDDEFQKYIAETEKIAKLYYSSKNEEEKERWFTLLCIKRQKIIVNATNKYAAFKKILDELGEKISHCVVYCSEEQIDHVREILAQRNINYHSFTMEEGIKPEEKYGGISERDFLLQKFNEGVYQVLVAIRCLDEGVNIPPARIGVILASSGNPRQYIQRRGRLLRRSPEKKKAIIYDILVLPPTLINMPIHLLHLERKILSKELKRYREFADASLNSLECLNKIYDIEKKFGI